ncbi:MAG: hypothetical protein JW940_39610 [Polyangiaceae bacterium]|nr:hypothetical protein [Polyangiaceae bacterium]
MHEHCEERGLPHVDELGGELMGLSQTCREYVRRAVGTDLDDTPDTLPVLDHYIDISRDTVHERPELMALVARAVGAYFGEVIRVQMDGFWYLGSPDAKDWYVCARSVFLAINPVGAAYEALTGTSEHTGPSAQLWVRRESRARVEQRLGSLPPVSEPDYYRLSTRLEALEVAAAALAADSMARGEEPVELGRDDYARELG